MFNLILSIPPILSLYFFRKHIQHQYKRFLQLRDLVKTKESRGEHMILYGCFNLYLKSLWVQFLQYIYDSIVHREGKLIIITYVINGHFYRIPIRIKKGPQLIDKVIDEEGKDCKLDVIPFFGPDHNWHGQELTPSFWNKKNLKFTLHNGTQYSFSVNEKIVFN